MPYTAIRSFYVEYTNYVNLTSNETRREAKLIPDIKTKEKYCLALEQAVYSLITEGNEEEIILLLQDAKQYDKLPTNFRSIENLFTIVNGKKVTLRLKIKKGKIRIEGENIKISSFEEIVPRKLKNQSVVREKILKMRQVLLVLEKLYTD